MTLSTRQQSGILLSLALVMIGTRVNHFSALPDASWALFFVGGFYLRDIARLAFPALMALAVLVDWYVIRSSGLSFWDHYCVSAAYWFLLPAYLSLWLGGLWLHRQFGDTPLRNTGLLLASFMVAVSACFLISNGSFYWLSDSVGHPTLAGWSKNLGDWYLPYLYTAAIYVGIAAALHGLVMQFARSEAVASARSTQR